MHPVFSTRRLARWRWILGLCVFLGLSHPASAEPADGQTFKDWVIRCGKANEAAPVKPCVMGQSLAFKDAEKPIMQILVGILKADQKAIIVFTVPLGVRLPPGLSLQVDQTEEIKMPYQQCIKGGCRARLVIDRKLEAALKAGLQGTATFVNGAGREVVLKISLKGFTAALNSLR